MSEQTLDLVETLWGSMKSAAIAIPTLLRSTPGGRDHRDSGSSNGPLFMGVTNEVAPGGQGGECIFYAAHVAITWTAPALLQIIGVVDGLAGVPFDTARPLDNPTRPASIGTPYLYQFLDNSGGLQRYIGSVRLLQQPGYSQFSYAGQAVPRSQVFTIPIMSEVFEGTANVTSNFQPRPVARTFLRGARCSVLIQAFRVGAGLLSIDGVELEYEVVRKSRFPGEKFGGFINTLIPGPVSSS